jgi:hypothetical protein
MALSVIGSVSVIWVWPACAAGDFTIVNVPTDIPKVIVMASQPPIQGISELPPVSVGQLKAQRIVSDPSQAKNQKFLPIHETLPQPQ